MNDTQCIFCRGREADPELNRIEVWQDDHWRLTVALRSEVRGFAYLEPKRHISHIHSLDGGEARTFGIAMARSTEALKAATGSDVVYVYIFGDGVPHLHVHLAPHLDGDALNDQMIRGEIIEQKMPNGMTHFQSEEFPPLPRSELEMIAKNVKQHLSDIA